MTNKQVVNVVLAPLLLKFTLEAVPNKRDKRLMKVE
jgi:hypothetical protein